MKLIPVTKLPDPEFKSEHKNLAKLCSDFLKLNVKYARVEFAPYDYNSVHSAYTSLRSFIRGHDYKSVYVKVIHNDLYFVRTDWEDNQ